MAHYGYQWPKYVSVAERRRKARQKMDKLRKQGMNIQPVEIEGRKIAKTFWGQAWCDQMESLGDFENRLPRGRTYVRNGSVRHLGIMKGRVKAMVSGSSMYNIEVKIDTLPRSKWNRVKGRCAGEIGSLIELLQGKLSASVMEVVTDRDDGLFPTDAEIHLDCDCPDWAGLCKHLAAVLYGVGARLDEKPELLFLLRGVKHDELIDGPVDKAVAGATGRGGRRQTVGSDDLADVFGIDIEDKPEVENGERAADARKWRRKAAKKKATAKKKPVKKKKAKTKAAKKKSSTPESSKKKPSSPAKKKAVGKNKTSRKKSAAKKKTSTKRATKKPTKKTKKKYTSVKSKVKKRTPTKRAKKTPN